MKEIQGDRYKWRFIPYLWLGRFIIVKMSVFPSAIYEFNTISKSKSYQVIFVDTDHQLSLQFIWKEKDWLVNTEEK